MPSRLSTLYPKILQLAQLFGTNVPSATMEVTTSAPNTTFTIAALAASYVTTMSHADVTVRTGIVSTWTNLETFNLSNAGLSQSDVNTLLSELYAQAQVKTSEGAAVIDLRNNAVPSGTYQSACPPTTGKEFAYALLNDPCTVIAHPYTSVLYDA